MIKKETIKHIIWFMIILTNVIFWLNIYSEMRLKAQRLVFQVTDALLTDKRINVDKNQYLFADNNVSLINVLTGVRRSTVYSKDIKDVTVFKRYSCETSDENVLEYSRNDDNINYLEKAQAVHQITVSIPTLTIIKSFFNDNQTVTIQTSFDNLSVPLNINYLVYKHRCGTFADWSFKINN